MTVFTIFICFQNVNVCDLFGLDRYTGQISPAFLYRDAEECKHAIRLQQPRAKERDGHFWLTDTTYLECRGRHVETWEPAG